ncbi:MAG: YfhO family protein [Verrucomicrobia bacterium]|nr:YfhO family protein [Verrucomicrobiota bacterium]
MNRLMKYFLVALAAVLGISLLWMVILAAGVESRAQYFANGGYDLFVPPNTATGEKASQIMAAQPGRAMFHFFVVTVLAGAMMVNLLWLNGAAKPLLRWGCCGGLALLLYVEQWSATSHFFDYYRPAEAYADNAIFQKLRDNPGRQRVAMLTRAGYYNTWLSLHLPYFDIDTLNVPQLGFPTLFEYSRALPRALVLHRWEVLDDKDKLLARLVDPKFDPHSTVLLGAAPPLQPNPNAPPSTAVDIVSFKPARVELKTSLKSPGVLMLNDRYDTGWTATVDGAPAAMQPGNFIMRAVPLPPGEHRVVFHYNVPTAMWWLTWGEWTAIVLGLAATGVRALRRRK